MTPITPQPDVTADKGLILECGITYGRNQGALVMPFASVNAMDRIRSCKDLVLGFAASATGQLQNCLSSDAYISFVAAHGMVHSVAIPYRTDFVPTDLPGLRAAGLADGQVSAVCLLYCDNNAPAPKGHMQIGKTFIPGLADADVSLDFVNGALTTNIETFIAVCCNGFFGGDLGNVWNRYGSARRTAGAALPKVVAIEADGIVATQRRRLSRA